MNQRIRVFNHIHPVWLLMLGISMGAVRCGDDDLQDTIPGEEPEVINRIILTFTSGEDETSPIEVTWEDKDGDGGDEPEVDPITLQANTTYSLSVKIGNTLADPDIDITEEIEEEAEDHLLIFSLIDEELITIAYDDKESDYVPDQEGEDYDVGLRNVVTTGEAGETTLEVLLLHLPGIKTGVGDTDRDNGEVDISVEFPLTVEAS